MSGLSEQQLAAISTALASTEPATDEQVRAAVSDALSTVGHNYQPLINDRLRRANGQVPAIVRRLLDVEARLADAELPPTGRPSAAEYRLEQYAQPPRTFESETERALFAIAIGLRQVLADTRARRDDARAGREDAEAEVERLRAHAQMASEYRLPVADGGWLAVRREHGGDRWGIRRHRYVIHVWSGTGWVTPDEALEQGTVWPFADAGIALTEAQRLAEDGAA